MPILGPDGTPQTTVTRSDTNWEIHTGINPKGLPEVAVLVPGLENAQVFTPTTAARLGLLLLAEAERSIGTAITVQAMMRMGGLSRDEALSAFSLCRAFVQNLLAEEEALEQRIRAENHAGKHPELTGEQSGVISDAPKGKM